MCVCVCVYVYVCVCVCVFVYNILSCRHFLLVRCDICTERGRRQRAERGAHGARLSRCENLPQVGGHEANPQRQRRRAGPSAECIPPLSCYHQHVCLIHLGLDLKLPRS